MQEKQNYSSTVSKYFKLFRQSLKGDEQDYTVLSIDRAIFLLAIPMILEMAMESIFAVVDVFYVSRLGNEAVATIGLTESMLMIIYSLAIGMSMAATAMVARRIGEKNFAEASLAGTQALYLGFGMSLIIGVTGFWFAEDLLRLMGASESLISTGANYTRWMLAGNFTVVLLFLNNAIFRGAGDASLAMKVLILANLLNIVIAPMFIFGFGPIPAFGVEGAAIGTNIGRGVGVLAQFYVLIRGNKTIKLLKENLAIRWELIVRLIKVSAGGTGQFLIASASWIFLVRIISVFGSDALAGYTIALRVIVFAILPAWGMANAASTLVGQNLGALQPERAEKSVWRAAFLNLCFLAFITVIFFVFADSIVGIFTEELVVAQYAIQCLQVVSLGYIFYAYGMVVVQAFNGAGDTKTPTLLNFFGFWLFQIPLAYTLAIFYELGPLGAFLAIPIAESVLALVSIYIFKKGHWKKTQI